MTSFEIEGQANDHIATLAWWKFSGHGSAAADATGNGNTAKLNGDAAYGCGKSAAPDGYRCSLAISGHGGQALTSTQSLLPIVDVGWAFTASAWVNVTRLDSDQHRPGSRYPGPGQDWQSQRGQRGS